MEINLNKLADKTALVTVEGWSAESDLDVGSRIGRRWHTGTIAMLNIENKVVITGASSGIGEAIAILLANHGAKVVLGARRADKLERIVAEIRSSGGTAESKAVDVTPHERP